MVQNCENAQEYIFDGGDLEPGMVLRKDGSVIGIDPTDTVAYYQTEAGTICVRPSNRVPIYAPRFGAVRQVSGVQLSTRAIGATPIIAPLNVVQLDEANLASTMVQPVSPLGQQQVSLIDAFEENYGGKPIAQVIPVERLSKALVPNQNIESQNPRMIMEDETAVLGRILERVEIASLPESVVVLVDGRAASVTRSTLRAQDVYLYEMPDKCSLRLCKSTSHTIVNPGDIVRFTLRFDNVGVKPLSNAVIVDSLSPRLDYIDGSQQCSVETRFSATPNDVGSMVLQWEIADSIDSSEGGVISFDCRVR
jgi:uncharacterized repeat protein (TIGR01451 family)